MVKTRCSLLLLAVLSLGAAVHAGEPDVDVRKAVLSVLEQTATLPIDAGWDLAASIVEQGAADKVLPVLLERSGQAGAKERLAIARALSLLDKPDETLDALAAVLADAEAPPDVRASACRALAVLPAIAGRKRTADLLDAMLSANEPELQLAAADSMLRFQRYTKAIAVLMRLAARTDAMGDEAALALAEHGYRNWVEERVMRIWNRPTPAGRRAFMLLKKSEAGFPGAQALEEIYSDIQNYYVDWEELKAGHLVDAAARGMVQALDPFSEYLNALDVKDMDESITGRYGGIGAYVGMHNGVFTIISPIYSGPAYRVGLRSMDMVYEVDSKRTADLRFIEVVKRLRGEPGTAVNVKIYRAGWPKPRDFKIVRELINVDSTLYTLLPLSIGYVRLTRFGDTTPRDCRQALVALKKQGARAFILDVRDNGGGLLEAAIETADLFLEQNRLIVYSVGRPTVSPRRNFYAREPSVVGDEPLVVLVNSGSASASEILAGALQDWKKALLVGEKTYGKGSVQTLLDLRSVPSPEGARTGSKLKLTIAKYYLPTGRCVHEKGVEPDLKIAAAEMQAWKLDALAENESKVEEYVRELVKKAAGRLEALAEFDGRDITRYPGLDALAASINDPRLAPDDLRRYVRGVLRRRVADMRGKLMVADIEEDTQLRRGVLEVLKQLSVEAVELPEAYHGIFAEFAKQAGPEVAAKPDEPEQPAAQKQPEAVAAE